MAEDEVDDEGAPFWWPVLQVAVVGLIVVLIGSWFLVRFLDLDENFGPGVSAPGPVQPIESRPTPDQSEGDQPSSGGSTSDPTSDPTFPVPDDPDALFLSASPVFVAQMERINLTGQWPGQDAVTLAVQRFEDGTWVDFGVQTSISVGTYGTYVMSGRLGENLFRMIDPATGTTSNEVSVTVE